MVCVSLLLQKTHHESPACDFTCAMQQGATVSALSYNKDTVLPLWHEHDSLQAQLVQQCCSQAADAGQHQFGVTWLQQSQKRSNTAAVPPRARVTPTFVAMQKGLLQPNTILQLVSQQPADSMFCNLYMVGKCMTALAKYGRQPEIYSHCGYMKLMEFISTADEPETERLYWEIAEGLARIGAHIPPAAVECLSRVAVTQACSKLKTIQYSILISLGSCLGPDAEPYLELRQQITSSFASAESWSTLLLVYADLQFSSDTELLGQAAAAILQDQMDRTDDTKMVRVMPHCCRYGNCYFSSAGGSHTYTLMLKV